MLTKDSEPNWTEPEVVPEIVITGFLLEPSPIGVRVLCWNDIQVPPGQPPERRIVFRGTFSEELARESVVELRRLLTELHVLQ